jgi:hypothetical protein
VARQHLHQHVHSILQYKILAEKDKVRGVPNCTSQDLHRQIKLLFANAPEELGQIDLTAVGDAETLNFNPDFKLVKWTHSQDFKGVIYFRSLCNWPH